MTGAAGLAERFGGSVRNALSDLRIALVRERICWRPASAREAALRILAARYGPPPPDPAGEVPPYFDLADFQRDAVRRAEEILSVRRGVLIADSVGLGKTFVALALVERALRAGDSVVVATPASLRREWVRPLRRLAGECGVGRAIGIGGDGGPGRAPLHRSREPPRAGAPLLAWVSHSRLGRGGFAPPWTGRPGLVVVDEAHAFRSPRTRRYRALAEICRGARVVLLTATPVNNSLWDLYFQLRLFAGDADFHDVGVPDLGALFRAAADARPGVGAGTGSAPPALFPVLGAVMVRRTRPFLRERYRGVRLPGMPAGAGLSFPRRAPPTPVRYSLGDTGPERWAEAIRALEALTLAALAPDRWGDGGPGEAGGEAELVRLLLLKRLESSTAAFAATLRRQLRFHRAVLDALGGGRLLAPAEHRAFGRGPDDAAQLFLGELVLRPVPPGFRTEEFGAAVAEDSERLRRLLRAADAVTAERDPKLKRLRALLDGELRGEKVVVFSEFRETARYLWRALAGRGGLALVDGAGAFLGRRPSGRRTVIERFAPRSNGAREPPPRERVDTLIATDVLAEGLNLQDAGAVVSYDLPWNPVRLVQRVGRIDRLGSPHEVIRSYHFLPDRGLEALLRLLDRLRRKLAAIGRSVGVDAPVLGAGEDAGPGLAAVLDRLAAGDPEVLDDIERQEAAPFEAEERLRAAYLDACRAGAATAGTGPYGAGAVPAAVHYREAGGEGPAPEAPTRPGRRVLLAYALSDRCLWLIYDPDRDSVTEDLAGAAAILAAALHERVAPAGEPASSIRCPPSPRRRPRAAAGSPPPPAGRGPPLPAAGRAAEPDPVLLARAAAAAEPIVRARAAQALVPPALPPHAPAARAARRLLGALADTRGDPDPELCRRADRLLAALARGHDAGTEAALREVLRHPPAATAEEEAERVLAKLERVLAASRPVAGASEPRAAMSREPETAMSREPETAMSREPGRGGQRRPAGPPSPAEAGGTQDVERPGTPIAGPSAPSAPPRPGHPGGPTPRLVAAIEIRSHRPPGEEQTASTGVHSRTPAGPGERRPPPASGG